VGLECGGGEGDCRHGCLMRVSLRTRRRAVGRRLSAGVLAVLLACAGTAAGAMLGCG
jgi:hypothetical protein